MKKLISALLLLCMLTALPVCAQGESIQVGALTGPTAMGMVKLLEDGKEVYEPTILGSADELFDIGWEDYLARGGVCAVEWSENVEDALEGAIAVTIEKDPVQPDRRSITIEGGARFEALGI